MVNADVAFQAQSRTAEKKSDVTRLRGEGFIPAVVYSKGKAGVPVKLNEHDFEMMLKHHSGENLMIDLQVDGQSAQHVLIKEIQHHPLTSRILHVDFHEMSWRSSYFFFPPARPHNPIYPDYTFRWSEYFGQRNASAFDRRGWLYFTEERFDLLYPGYGDTWPTFNGAVGMTYEQGGSGRAGLAVITAEGDTLTLGERELHSPLDLTLIPEDGAPRSWSCPPGDFQALATRTVAGELRHRVGIPLPELPAPGYYRLELRLADGRVGTSTERAPERWLERVERRGKIGARLGAVVEHELACDGHSAHRVRATGDHIARARHRQRIRGDGVRHDVAIGQRHVA